MCSEILTVFPKSKLDYNMYQSFISMFANHFILTKVVKSLKLKTLLSVKETEKSLRGEMKLNEPNSLRQKMTTDFEF